MKRDMELIRKILFAIEEQYVDTVLYNLQVDGYDINVVAYHCDLLYQAGLVKDYGCNFADDEIYSFGVGALTWDGHDYLDKIRSDTVWNKTKAVAKEKGIPLFIDSVKEIATAVVAGMVQGAIK